MSNRVKGKQSSAQRVKAASNAGKGRSTTWIWIAVVVAVVVIGAVVIAVGRGGGSSSSGGGTSPSGGTVVPNGKMDYGTIKVSGTKLAELRQDAADASIGQTIPQISGTQFDGKQLDILPSDGKPKIIMVVAHWCPHCQAEVPRLQQWLDDAGMPADVELVTIATGNDAAKPNFPAADWLRREKWSVPTMVDDKANDAAAALGVSAFPFFVVTNGQGQVIFRTSGELTQTQWNALLTAARTGVAPTA